MMTAAAFAVSEWSSMDLSDASDSRLADLSGWVIEDLGFAGASIAPASADASFRRYFRVTRGTDTYIAMDAPPDKEDLGPFLSVARILLGIGLNVPIILAQGSEARAFCCCLIWACVSISMSLRWTVRRTGCTRMRSAP